MLAILKRDGWTDVTTARAFKMVPALEGRPVVVPRPREGRATRRLRSSTRGDPDPPEPSASPFQAAHRALLSLTAGELDALADIAERRAAILRASRWAA